jgi:hypothetical protein
MPPQGVYNYFMLKRIEMPRVRMRLFVLLLFVVLGITYLPPLPTAEAANFSMQTGYYVGTGVGSRAITGVGFQPNLVIIKSTTTAGVAVFKTSSMTAANTAFLSATADNAGTSIALNSNGFTLGTLANVNSANVVYTWTAFTGSDCSATGNFCVGTFTGNAAATRTITTGFQPSLAIVKRSTAVGAHFRTASMAANRSEFFTSTAADTAGNYIRSTAATSFDVGATDNASAAVYYYVAFKAGAGAFAEGTYTGNGVAARAVTGVGFQPDLLFVKNSTSATVNNRRAVMSSEQSYGDNASFTGDAVADTTNFIQALQSDGFLLGSGVNTNENTFVHYWFAFGGSPGRPPASGSFTAAQGSYTGTGATLSIAGLSFAPDVILIKDNAANFAVFRTRQMAGDSTAYLASATADFAGGVTALNADGFTLGASTITNTAGGVYHWQAFGNAYNPDTGSGSTDFAIGTYYGTGIDNKDITALPYQPDFVAVKRNNTTAGMFRTSAQAGDIASSFGATAEAANMVQSLTASGFQVGTSAANNTAASTYRWFAFKESSNFNVGSYTGDAVNDRQITTPAFGADLVWVKRSTAVAGVLRPATLAGDNTQYFPNTANASGRIKSLTAVGFTLGTQTEVNAAAGVYRYAAWRVPPNGILSADIVDAAGTSVTNPNYSLNAVGYLFDCAESTGTVGSSTQKIRVSNMTGSASWTTSVAATDGATALWRNGGNTLQFDFNDGGGSPAGCADAADSDSKAGRLRLEPSAATVTPAPGCALTNISLGADQSYSEGTIDAITLASASAGANAECYWDLTNVNMRQTIPAEQPVDSYLLNLTVTTVAS